MDYPHVIMTSERPETLFSFRDFLGLVNNKLGLDAKRFLESVMEEKDDEIEEKKQDAEELYCDVKCMEQEVKRLIREKEELKSEVRG